MWTFFSRKHTPNCKFQNLCTVCEGHKTDYCQLCKQYRFIDSGYGWCNLSPEPVTVGWCKDPCSYYTKVREDKV